MSSSEIYDVVGLGFGPANLAVAGALVEKWSQATVAPSSEQHIQKVLFLEKHDKFRWHPGMLLPDARMQISFLKDLAMLRSPTSPITFLSYLHTQGRLVSFINRGSNIPTRREYADYLAWAASYVQNHGINVLYGHEVIGLSEGADGTIQIRSRFLATEKEVVHHARNIIISPGGSPRIPPTFSSVYNNARVIHSSNYLTRISSVIEQVTRSDKPVRIAVVGSGQSAAEVALNLRERLGAIPCRNGYHQVDMIFRKGALKPSDDSPFSNEIFDPSETSVWFALSNKRVREARLADYQSTNYGVVNSRTLEQLYEVIYDQKVGDSTALRTGEASATPARLDLRAYTNIIAAKLSRQDTSVDPCPGVGDLGLVPFVILSQHTLSQEIREYQYDAIVCATGYQRTSWVDLLRHSDIGKHFGLHPWTLNVRLVSTSERLEQHAPRGDTFLLAPLDHYVRSETDSPSSTSSVSTPPTSPGPSPAIELSTQASSELCISRSYQLLPLNEEAGEALKPRIYLQGVEEVTHGLSDTLLSVMSIRAGEVVNDLYGHPSH